jgi:hypothetical protein
MARPSKLTVSDTSLTCVSSPNERDENGKQHTTPAPAGAMNNLLESSSSLKYCRA